MAILFSRKAAVPLWVIVFALVVLFSPQAGVAPGMLLLVGGGLVAPALLALLFNGRRRRTPAEVQPHPVEASPTVIAARQ
jgi:hypothetical protein